MCQKCQHCMEQPALFIFDFRSRLNLMRKKCTDKQMEFKIGACLAERANHNRHFSKSLVPIRVVGREDKICVSCQICIICANCRVHCAPLRLLEVRQQQYFLNYGKIGRKVAEYRVFFFTSLKYMLYKSSSARNNTPHFLDEISNLKVNFNRAFCASIHQVNT